MAFKDRKYTNEERIEAYLSDTLSIEVGAAAPYILATQRFIEGYTGRVFRADDTATARQYDGSGTRELCIDDCVEITTVQAGNDVWGDSLSTIAASGTDRYYTLPTNNEADDVPINKLLLRNRIWVMGHANNTITAKWGYSVDVPDDIKWAATVIASAMYYENKGENSGPIKSEKIGEYSVSYADTGKYNDKVRAMQILDNYKKILI